MWLLCCTLLVSCAKVPFCACRRKKDDGTEPEVDPERDQRTVFAFQVSLTSNIFMLHFIHQANVVSIIAAIFEGR